MASRAATHLMYAGEASAALDLYTAVFDSFRVEHLDRHGPGEPGAEGTVKRADASLDGHALVFIDSPVKHAFTFTPSMSLFRDFEAAMMWTTPSVRCPEGGQPPGLAGG